MDLSGNTREEKDIVVLTHHFTETDVQKLKQEDEGTYESQEDEGMYESQEDERMCESPTYSPEERPTCIYDEFPRIRDLPIFYGNPRLSEEFFFPEIEAHKFIETLEKYF